MIKGHACKITAMSTSKTGKHGHAKCKFMAVDIFDGTKHEMIETSTHNVSIPNVTRMEYQLVDIDDDYLHLMDDKAEIRQDIKLPADAELAEKIRAGFDSGEDHTVTILSAIGRVSKCPPPFFHNRDL